MTKRKSADTPALRRLGREISRLRKLADMSQEQLGKATGLSSGMIGHIERAERSPTKKFIEKADEILAAGGHLLELWPDVVRSSYPEYAGDVLDAIPQASIMRDYHPTMIPGLLQTESYARAALRAGNPYADQEHISNLADGRLKLQRLLDESATPIIWAILTEWTIRYLASEPDILVGQIDKLLALSGSGRIRLQLIPTSLPFREHPGLDGPLTILSFPHEQDVAYIEGEDTGALITKAETVERLALKFGSLQSVALSSDQSTTLLKRIRGEVDGQRSADVAQIELQQQPRGLVRGDRPDTPDGSHAG